MKKSYCSFLPTQAPEIESCCQKHDQAYGYAGPEKGRKLADVELRECAISSGASPWIAWAAYVALRAFGWVRWYWVRFSRKIDPSKDLR